MYEEIISKIKFDDKGLVPAVVQDFYTGEVLTVAYNEVVLTDDVAFGNMVAKTDALHH